MKLFWLLLAGLFGLLFVGVCGGFSCNERNFTHIVSLTQICAKEAFSERFAKPAFNQEQKYCVEVHDGNIAYWNIFFKSKNWYLLRKILR